MPVKPGQCWAKWRSKQNKTNTQMEEPAPMGYHEKEDLEEENLMEEDDSENENLTGKENLKSSRNKEEKEPITADLQTDARNRT